MSVTFQIAGARAVYTFEADADATALNVNVGSARDILDRLDLAGADLWGGEIPAYELAERCRDALESIEARLDCGREESSSCGRRGCLAITAARPAGRINAHLRDLLEIAELAGERGMITWN